ncbi:MAG: DNA repair protein RecN [Deltaproteobacteria bacterium]
MLRLLKISNLAIIDRVEIEFQDGFNVLTGETGAGKSILIGALNLLLGSRFTPDLIRTGEDEANVEALFEVPEQSSLPHELSEVVTRTGELLLARKVFRSGRSRCFINGNLATLAMLDSAGGSLVSIFGQREHQVLINPDEHVEILDRFGGLDEALQQTSRTFHSWKDSVRTMEQAVSRLEELERVAKENADAAEELTAASLKEGEEEELASERDILRKAAQIRERAFEAYQALYGRSGSIIESFADVKKAADYLASINQKLVGMKENLEEALYRIEDVALELRGIAEKSQGDPVRLEQIEERLALIKRLKRKFGTDLQGLLLHLENLNQGAGEVFEARSRVKQSEQEVRQNREAYLAAAQSLSAARKDAAAKLEASMKRELNELAMPSAAFSVEFEYLGEEKGLSSGLEKVEFFLSANPGETPRPLARVASGGELSRIMLAVKALQADDRRTGTVIFDEVDAGIGGHTAFAVGSRLARVAARQQVLCVTHLHQIAAMADHHLSVRKSVRGGRTRIEVTPLDRETRVSELTRMLGASPGSESAREHVRRLMDLPAAEVPG